MFVFRLITSLKKATSVAPYQLPPFYARFDDAVTAPVGPILTAAIRRLPRITRVHTGSNRSIIVVLLQHLFFLKRNHYSQAVPRKTPLSEEDAAIGRRLKQLRMDRQFSREELANRAGIAVGIVTRVELGRMPLRYLDGKRLLRALSLGMGVYPDLQPINPLWLAEGREPIEAAWPLILPPIHHLNFDPTASFLSVIAAHRELLANLITAPTETQIPEAWLSTYLNHWETLSHKVQTLSAGASTVEQVFWNSAKKISPLSPAAAGLMKEYRDLLGSRGEKKPLTVGSEIRNTPGMQSELQGLLAKVKRLTQAKGLKARLAATLGVPAPRISEWLAGKYEPSGETTLRLLHWVEQQEAQQKTSPGSASTLPGPKTRMRNPDEKKSKSSPS
jgi:transcriptional regulator with XRE-family HTH domain